MVPTLILWCQTLLDVVVFIFINKNARDGGRFGGKRGSGFFIGRCFDFNEVGHQSFRFPKWIDLDKGK